MVVVYCKKGKYYVLLGKKLERYAFDRLGLIEKSFIDGIS